MRIFLVQIILLLFVQTAYNQNFYSGYSFTLPPFDSTTQEFLPHFERKPITGFITASRSGQFLANGAPIRFWGVNLTTGACFPDKADAAGIAARMRKMGINLVRFHHMDNPWSSSEGTIFNRNGSTRNLNAVTLDRLHYFVAKLKEEGIYVNLNLHVSRTFTEADGVLYADSIPDFGKGVTFFDEYLIQLQKEFAGQLLSTVNPYTSLSLAEEPAVAMVEITNENTVYGFWKGDRLQPLLDGGMLLSRHTDTLNRKWNAFLQDKYDTHADLQAAWDSGQQAPSEELILDGDFENGDLEQHWALEQHETSQATMSASTNVPHRGKYCAEIRVMQATGTNWHIQFQQGGASLDKDSTYIVRFFARAAFPRQLGIGLMRNAPPWTWYGGTSVQLTTQWREYRISIKAPEQNNGLTRLTFSLGSETGTVWLDDVSLQRSQRAGLRPGENLSTGNIQRIRYSDRGEFHPQRVADLAEFYLKIQKEYYEEMHTFLVKDLKVKAPITGSNALSGAYESFAHQSLDFIDDHAYWNHPRFPNQPWSPWDWTIDNESMLNTDFLGNVPGIFGGYQIQDKPFTISEYNHSQPNIYQAEMVPILAAYGAFHGADGFMFFNYNDGTPADWTTDVQDGFFNLHRNTPVMALFPLFAHAYRQGWIAEDADPLLVDYTAQSLYNMPQEDNNGRWGKYYSYNNNLALTSSIRIRSFDTATEHLPTQAPMGPPFTTSSGEITFHPDLGVLEIRNPYVQSIAGFLANASQISGDRLRITRGEKHGVLAWVSLTGEPVSSAGRSLLALASRFQNQNMIWDGMNTVHDDWGHAPTEVQPLSLEIQLNIEADSIRLYPLDPLGQPQDGLSILPQSHGQFIIALDQHRLRSLWFGIEAFRVTTGTEQDRAKPTISVFPNPASPNTDLTLRGLRQQTPYELRSLDGKRLRAGFCTESISLLNLPPGSYILILSLDNKQIIKRITVQ